MVDLALITAETVMVKKGDIHVPCVVLIGRDKEDNKLSFRMEFKPYCYIDEADFTELQATKEFNFKRYCGQVPTFVRGLNKKALSKLEFPTSRWLTDFDKVYHKLYKRLGRPFYTYEADLSKPGLLALRFLIDMGIRSGVRITKEKGKPARLEPIEGLARLRKWYLDFESYAQKMCSTGLKKNIPLIMCSYWDTYRNKLRTLWVDNPKWKDPFEPEPLFKGHELYRYDTEALFLEGLLDDVKAFNPDLFSAWNLERYDFPKWESRMRACNLEPKNLSPLKSYSWRKKPFRIKGRILFDLMKGFKRFTKDAELRSYSLAYVIEAEKFNIEKVPFVGTPAETWDNFPEIMLRRNVNDVLVLKELDEKYDLIEIFDDLRRTFGALFHEVLISHRVLDTALMRFVHGKVALRSVRRKRPKKKKEDKFLGAVVVKPITGPHIWLVQFDFSREYPQIIRTFNIGPETYRANGKGYYKITAPDGTVHSFVRNPRSLLAQLIDHFFNLRDRYELEYQAAIERKDKVAIKTWWRRVYNIKRTTNAIYGVMDFDGFRLSKGECSAAVALIGREGIECLDAAAKRVGYKLIYGDTDSVFVQLKGKYGWDQESLLKEAKWLRDEFDKALTTYFKEKYEIPAFPAELGVRKIYSRFLMIAKKSYAGKGIWDEKKAWTPEGDFEFKGIEVIRSDSSWLEKQTLENLIKMYLNGKTMEELRLYWYQVIKDFRAKRYNYFEVSYPLQIKHPFTYYTAASDKEGKKKSAPAHVRAALYSNTFLNTGFEQSDKPRRLPIDIGKHKSTPGQMTLTGGIQTYPVIWKYKDPNGEFNWPLRDISVAEDMVVPQWFIEHIDWSRIFSRLKKKVDKILTLIEGFKWEDVGLNVK